MSNINSKKIAITALMSAFSIILATIANLRLPFLTFFKLDFSDIPIFILSFLLGVKHGITSLFVVSIIRMLTGDSVLLSAFALRMSTSVVVFFINIYNKYQKNFAWFAAAAIICNIVIRAPISYYMWINCYNVPKEIFINKMWSNIILLTTIRLLFNITISKLIFNYLSKNSIVKNEQK